MNLTQVLFDATRSGQLHLVDVAAIDVHAPAVSVLEPTLPGL